MMDVTEQIKQRIPLEDVVAEVVALKPAGRGRLKGLCPFHGEKSPSFTVNTEKGFYYCFGCQAKGDIYTFVQQSQGLDFRSALEQLAIRAGVELPERAPQKKTKDFYDALSAAQDYFVLQFLESQEAQDYLLGRGLTPDTVAQWGLGYAPDGWQGLITALRKDFSLELLERAGLVNSKDGRYYDFFRNRVTIPIRDTFGRIVGFSARTLSAEEKAKYINTPETEVFRKGDLLFGLDKAKDTIRAKHAAILVEGHLDVIALHQGGFSAVVGAQSATLTEGQITSLERLGVMTLWTALDADEAGQRATLAACESLARRMVVKVAQLSGKDPAEMMHLPDGAEAFRAVLREAVSEVDYRIARAKNGLDLETPTGNRTFLERLRDGMRGRGVVDPVAEELMARVSASTGVPVARLRDYAGDKRTSAPISVAAIKTSSVDQGTALQLSLATILLLEPDHAPTRHADLNRTLPQNDPVVQFAERVAGYGYDVYRACEHLPDDAYLAVALEHCMRGGKVPRSKFATDLGHYARLVSLSVPQAAA